MSNLSTYGRYNKIPVEYYTFLVGSFIPTKIFLFHICKSTFNDLLSEAMLCTNIKCKIETTK